MGGIHLLQLTVQHSYLSFLFSFGCITSKLCITTTQFFVNLAGYSISCLNFTSPPPTRGRFHGKILLNNPTDFSGEWPLPLISIGLVLWVRPANGRRAHKSLSQKVSG